MRIAWPIAAALLVAGCTDADWSRWTNFDSPPDYPAPVSTVAPPPARGDTVRGAPVATVTEPIPREDCIRAARERSGDVAAQGFDEGTQKQVYDATYADCLNWAARTGAR